MKRKIIDELIMWKELNSGIPVLLAGAKGVGKTYLAYDFAKAFFQNIYYINFEREPAAQKLFTSTDCQHRKDSLIEYFHLNPENSKETRILILDEISSFESSAEIIQSSNISGLFGFIILISSYPLNYKYSGNFHQINVYPLEFDEFLLATGNVWYVEAITTHFKSDKKIPEIVHKELLELHQLYLQTGGMPGVVNEYLSLSSAINIPEQHCLLISAYHDCILKDNSDSDALKMNQVFDSISLQLKKESKKFQYNLIRKGTTHSMYQDAIRRLNAVHYIIKCNRISSEQLNQTIPIFREGTQDNENTNFKLYYSDIGLLYTKMIEEQGSTIDRHQRKALLENYVAQSLQARHYPFAFWESDSMAKIDFIIEKNNDLIPIEIHVDDNTRSKCISILKKKCNFPYAIKVSSRNFEFSNQIKYVPYYAVFCI